jgi:hypothetical protein
VHTTTTITTVAAAAADDDDDDDDYDDKSAGTVRHSKYIFQILQHIKHKLSNI